MKLLYSVIILGLIQMVFIKPLAAASKSNKTLFRRKLVQFYKNEMIAIDREYCAKAKMLIEKVLQDKLVQRPKTSIMREFKQNITDFLQEYPLYRRYNLNNDLMFQFYTRLPPHNKTNKELQYIWRLLKRQGYNEMDDDYENNHVKLVKQKLLPKFEELKKKLSLYELQQEKDLLMWYHELSKCVDYACLYNYLLRLEDPKPKEVLLDSIDKKLNNIYIHYGNKMLNISKHILKDQRRLSQLPKNLRYNLTIHIKDFIKQYETHRTLKQLHNLIPKFYNHILSKFYYNKTLTLKDQKLLKEIFDSQGCAKFVSELHDFVQHDVFEYFKQFKAALNRQELVKEKPLLQWYERLKGLHRIEDIMKAFNNLKMFKNNM